MPNSSKQRLGSVSSTNKDMEKRQHLWTSPTRTQYLGFSDDLDIELNPSVPSENNARCGKPILTRWAGGTLKQIQPDSHVSKFKDDNDHTNDGISGLDEIDNISRRVKMIQVKSIDDKIEKAIPPSLDSHVYSSSSEDDDDDDGYMQYTDNVGNTNIDSSLNSQISVDSKKDCESVVSSIADDDNLPLHLRKGECGIMTAWGEEFSSESDSECNLDTVSTTVITEYDTQEVCNYYNFNSDIFTV